MTEPLLGRSINRLEDERFVQGRGRYVADLVAPNALHGVVVRSPHAHARIVAIDVDAARRMPGVAAVLTGQESGCRRYRAAAVRGDPHPDGHAARGPALSRAGARRRSLCRRARRVRGRGKRRAPRATPPRPLSSTMSRCRRWSRSRMPFCRTPVDLAGGAGQHRVPVQPRRDRPGRGRDPRCRPCRGMRTGQQPRRRRAAGNPRCARRVRRGERPPAPDRLGRRRACDPRPARRRRVSRSPREKLRVSIPDVGGGFGMKNVLYPEWVLVLWAARRLGRPVKWIGDRSEDFTGSVAWPRQPRPGPPCARWRRPLPGARNQGPRQSGRLCLDGGAGRADHGDGERDGRRLRHPADRVPDQRRVHQHDAGRRLSRRRQARGELSDRALHRHRSRASSGWMR